MKIQRNASCPCGSGKKYKKCCLARDEAERREAEALEWRRQSFTRVMDKISTWVLHNHLHVGSGEWIEDVLGAEDAERFDAIVAELDETDDGFHSDSGFAASLDRLLSGETMLLEHAELSMADVLVGGVRPVGCSRPPLFEAEERLWLDGLLAAPLRLYEVIETECDVGLTLEDALSGERRRVREILGSRTIEVGMTLATRVVDGGEDRPQLNVIWAVAPAAYEEALPKLRKAERSGASEHFIADLVREAWLRSYLISMPDFMDAVSEEPILLVTQDYAVRDWGALSKALAGDASWSGDRKEGWVWLENSDKDVSRIMVSVYQSESHRDRIQLFGRTAQLAEEGQSRFESIAGDVIEYLGVETIEPSSLGGSEGFGQRSRGLESSSEALSTEFMQEFYESTYADFFEKPLPVFDDRSPREILATPDGQVEVKDLIRSYERSEARMARAQDRTPASFAFLRDRLDDR